MNRRQFSAGALLLAVQSFSSRTGAAAPKTRLPPVADRGLLGGTSAFLENPWSFASRRYEEHGPIFLTSVLGKKVVYLSGPDAMSAFLKEENVSRSGAHPPHVIKLFGGRNIQMMDAPEHTPLRALTMAGFNRAALTDYVPRLQELADKSIARWATEGELSGTEAMRQFAVDAICDNVLGVAAGERTRALQADYMALAAGFTAVPIRLPGSAYSKAMKARKRLLATLREVIAERRGLAGEDAASRVMAARTEEGRQITDDELLLELHHMVIAGYIVFALLAELISQLHQHPEIQAALRADLEAADALETLSIEKLYGLRGLQDLVNEGKRTTPIVPMVFGVAKKDFEVGEFTVPAGFGVWMSLSLCNTDPSVFTKPHAFDPARFSPGRAEQDAHPHAFVPQGGGRPEGHRCLGLEYSSVVAQVLVARLLASSEFTLPEQDLSLSYERLPPEHVDGLRMVVTPR